MYHALLCSPAQVVKSAIGEDQNAATQLLHAWQAVLRHLDILYPYRSQFASGMSATVTRWVTHPALSAASQKLPARIFACHASSPHHLGASQVRAGSLAFTRLALGTCRVANSTPPLHLELRRMGLDLAAGVIFWERRQQAEQAAQGYVAAAADPVALGVLDEWTCISPPCHASS